MKKGKPKNYLPDEAVKGIAALFTAGEPVEGEVAVIDAGQAADADYNLSPSRWVGQNGAATGESIASLAATLKVLTDEQLKVDASLSTALARLVEVSGE